MQFVFVTPWKLSSGSAKSWVEELLSRIERTTPVTLVAPHKALDSEKAIEQFLVRECEKIAHERGLLYFLDERGNNPSSDRFAGELVALRDRGLRQVGFVMGGAYGLPSALAPLLAGGKLLSLSQATFAHELSLVVLLEQVYRAETIRAKHPYHHGGASPLVAALHGRHAPGRPL
ncbi:MAG: 23S rRNA (pseudouridine(1915)-N(3))-methyltransferase RlmH [Betaproteobacteria bacterium]|nr:23S rRNA (pseudouridine(1915)-N(3))-methyltransferase RlmH [Betaproteobacteria bacterium]